MITLWMFLLFIFGSVFGNQYQDKNISVRCEIIEERLETLTFVCNITDNRLESSCPPLIPHFKNILIKCVVKYPFMSINLDCNLIDLLKPDTENNIISSNWILFYQISQPIGDVIVKFESIFTNVFSVGKAFFRCSLKTPYTTSELHCSLFGIGSKASSIADLSCSTQTENSEGNSTSLVRCDFSENHVFGKMRGNFSAELKTNNNKKKYSFDIGFDSLSNSPNLNIQEIMKMECQELDSEGKTFVNCGINFDDTRSCENVESSEENDKLEENEQEVDPHSLFDLDRKITININQASLGDLQVICNMAVYTFAHIFTCSARHSTDSIYFDDKAIVDFHYNTSTIYIDSAELFSFNKTDGLHANDIVIKRCYLHLSERISCDVQIGKFKLTRMECNIQEGTVNTYSVVCNFDNSNYKVEGSFTHLKENSTIIQFTFNGQLQSTSSGSKLDLNTSCNIRSTFSENSSDNSGWNVDCNNDVNIEQMCLKLSEIIT